MSEFETILAQHPFFEGMNSIYLRILSGCASDVSFNAGNFIFRQGDEANWFYLIRQGKVALELPVSVHGPLIIETLTDGDILGVSWLFPPYLCQWDAHVQGLVRAVAFNALCLRGLCEEDHDLGFELMKRFAGAMIQRLHAARLQCTDIYGFQMKSK